MRAQFVQFVAFAGTAALLAAAQPLVAAAEPDDSLPPRAEKQIEALAAAKASRTAVQSKIDSTLLTAVQLHSGRALPAGIKVKSAVPTDRLDRAQVEIRGRVTPALRQRVRSLGGLVRYDSVRHGVTRADVPLDALEELAALPQVDRLVSLASTPVTATVKDPRQRSSQLTKEQLGAERQRRIAAALAAARRARVGAPEQVGVAAAGPGSVVSQGDRTHGVDAARTQLKVSGVGVTVGVLSDGVDSLRTSIATGDLPADVEVLPGAAGAGDEGTAMLEIVHDLAPKAKLAFATAGDGQQGFADNIRALRAAGADIIVDDILYYGESPFQDGPVAQAVKQVSRAGALYLSAAGNEGNVDDRTSGNYEADFRSSGRSIGKFVGDAHDFDPGPGVQLANPTSAGSSGVPAILQWADPLGAADDDYDLYAVDAAGDVVAFSNTTQDGDDDPFEGFYVPDGGARLVVTKYDGDDRYFQLTAFRGRFTADGAVAAYTSPGVTRGHSATPAAVSVAAVPAAGPLPFDLEAGDPPNPSGPFPQRFTTSQLSERFTSDGPRHVFFTANGTPLTPGNLSSTGGRFRWKPTLAAADGVSTSVEGFSPFFGTSASAPHAAAMAALALSGHPGLRPRALRSAMARTAIDIERRGRDRDTGAGIVNARPLLDAVHAHGQPYVLAGDPVVTASGDGDTFIEPGETGTVSVPATNQGDVTATGVRIGVRASTPGIAVSPASQGYGSIPADQTKRRTYQVTVPATVALGTIVDLTATARFRGAYSPQSSAGRFVVGEPSTTGVTSTYSGPPVAIPDDSEDGAGVTLPVSGVGPVSGVTFSIDGTSCSTDDGSTTVGLDHTFVGDLVGTLSSPDGTTVTLFDKVGGSGNNFCQARFTDTADRSIQDAVVDDEPFTGTWRPAEALAAFLGEAGDGSWRFTAADTAVEDTGSIRAVSVRVRGFVAPPT